MAQDVVNSYAYTPFGIILAESENLENPFKFAGQYGIMYEGNGIYYVRARYYDASIGRFISEDPIGFAGDGPNLYAYVLNNPVNHVDPSGLIGLGGGGTGLDLQKARAEAKERARRRQVAFEEFLKRIRNMNVGRAATEPYVKVKIADKWKDLPYNARNYQNWNPIHWGKHPKGKRFNNYHVGTEYGEDGVYLHYDFWDVTKGPYEFFMHNYEEAHSH